MIIDKENKKQLMALGDKVIVKVEEQEREVFAGFDITPYVKGEVVSFGEYFEKENVDIKIGDTVLIEDGAVPIPFEYNNVMYQIFRKHNIIAIERKIN